MAGSGKSTLTRLVAGGDSDAQIADFIHTRIPAHRAYVVHSIPRLLPILAGTLGPGPRLSWPEVKLLVYVTEWSRFLRSRPEYDGRVTLLDQGPLYALVRLKAQGSNVTSCAAFERWWNEMLERWTRELSAVVWLDASDDVLWQRISGRGQRHSTRSGSSDEAFRFIGRYRALFEDVLRRVEVAGGPRVLRFDTGAGSAEDIASEIGSQMAAIGSLSRARSP